MEDSISQKNTWKYHIYCIFGKDSISFSCKYDMTQKSKDDLLPKDTLRDDFLQYH